MDRRETKMTDIILVAVVIAIRIGLVFLTVHLARDRNRNPVGYGLFTLLLPLPGTILVACMSKRNVERKPK